MRKASASMKKSRQAIVIGHANILRAITGLRKNTPHPILFAQVPEGAIQDQWLVRSANLWNSLCTLPDTSLFYALWQSTVREYQNCSSGWVMDLFARLQEVGCSLPLVGAPDPICIPLLLQRLELTSRDCYTPVMHACLSPRVFPSRGILLCTYLHWFSRPARSLAEFSPLDLPLSAKIVKSFLRFRSGCSGLPVDAGRFLGVPRHARVCHLCAFLDTCDEYHLVFDCGALADLRVRYAPLFTIGTLTMQEFMWQKDTKSVALFVFEALQRYAS